jgi:CheY-like chemotaxis protein
MIEVEDSGQGISPEDQHRLFQPFIQLGNQGENKGTGLGLSIARQFVQLMGGKLDLESQLGKGSIFRIDLPLKASKESEIVKTSEMKAGEVEGLAPGQPIYRILIVEDQLENQLLLTKLMERIGFVVKLAENGEQGVQLFQSWHPHLIWMDRRMPVMDGLEATRRIRALPDGKNVKIVAVTASAFKDEREETIKAGMDDFIRKPYRFNEIYDSLARQLGVKYRYATPKFVDEASVTRLSSSMLLVLPLALRKELEEALNSLESDRIATLIAQVASYDPMLYKTLSAMAERYDYPDILKALQEK